MVEKLRRPTGESRGLGFNARTMEVLDQRGLLPLMGEMTESPAGHFGGLGIDFGILDGAHWGAHGIPQARTEEKLADWAAGLGADIRRGWTIAALEQDATGVTVDLGTPNGPVAMRASWLVGCDGERSTVRKLAGFDFPGRAATLEMFLADVRGVEIEPRMIGERVPGGMVMAGQLSDDVARDVA